MAYPLATLSARISPSGITAPSYNDILQSLIATFQSIFGSDIVLTPDTQDYQWLAALAMAINDQNQTMIAIYNGFLPTYAQGAGLSALVKINGIRRIPATNSTATVTVTGTVGTIINNGVAQDANGNLWNLPPQVIIPGTGTINVGASAQVPGAIAAGANTINQIYTVVLGWQTVTNAAPATPGTNAETDAALRQRQALSTAGPALTPLQAIFTAVGNVIGVSRLTIYENSTASTDSNGLPSHSISVVVQGGTTTAIATAIESKKSPGTGTYGSTSITVNDPAGVPITINFYQLATTSIYVSLTIKGLTGYVSSTGTALIAALVAFINGLAIGQKVYYNWLLGIAETLGPLSETFVITAFTIGTAPSPVGTSDIAIAFNAAAITVTANIVLTTT
jgi:uncharacterized phage protein gp47/JayE